MASVHAAYNNASVAVTAAATPITILGTHSLSEGCAITTEQTGFRINRSGVYRISYDVTFTPSADGTETLQIYNDTTALPCSVTNATGFTGKIMTIHAESIVCIARCCAIHPIISAQINGIAGSVNHVCASCQRIC